MEEIRFRLLGNIIVADELGGWHTIGPTMPRALLATLLLEVGGSVVPARRLLDSLWDSAPPSATSNLRTYRTRLQRALDRFGLPNRVAGTSRKGEGYRLVADEHEVDACMFRNLVAAGGRLLRSGAFAQAAARYGDALALWRGQVGDDLPPTRRLSCLAEALNSERVNATEDRARALILAGWFRRAAVELRWAVADRPTRESVWVLLSCANYLSGNAAIAQETIRQGYRTLSDTVGLEPGADLRAAEDAAIHHRDGWFRDYLSLG